MCILQVGRTLCICVFCRLVGPARFVNFWSPPASGKMEKWTRERALLNSG